MSKNRWDISVLLIEGLKILKFSFKIFENYQTSGALIGYHCSNRECLV
jgi:hypothetical protein